MKFKKFLCFTLASVMTFTATLSSSASIFADDVEIQETEESQSFTSSIYDELFAQSQEGNLENPDDYGISPMWSRDGHEDIIDYNEGDLSEYHIRILKATSYWADRWFSSKDDAVFKLPALHGTGNYVINLEFLWYFAVFLGRQSNPTNATDMNNKINAAKNSAIDKIENTTAYKNKDNGENKLRDLIYNCETLVKYDGWKGIYNTTLTATEMKMRILGYAAHLLGDVYSHRTMLYSTSGLNMSFFKSSLKTDVPKGIVQFIDLNRVYLLDSNNRGKVNYNYIDKSTFCPKRYYDAKLNVSSMLTCKLDGFDYFLILCPHSNGVILNNLKKHVKNSGLNTSRLTESEWAKFST